MLITENQDDLNMSMDVSDMFMSSTADSLRFDIDCPLAPEDDFLQQLSNDLEIPMLLEESSQSMLHDSADDLMNEGSLPADLLEPYTCLDELSDVDGMQWGPDAFPNLTVLPEGAECKIKEEIKMEPASPMVLLPPSPSPSSSSSESWNGGESSSESKELSHLQFILDTPPMSPPQPQEGSPPTSPHPKPNEVGKGADPVLMVSPVKLVPLASNGAVPRGATKIVFTQSSQNGNKRIKIQPKPDLAGSPALTVPAPKRNEDSRTIVLSAQDFAALTQQVKNGTKATGQGVCIQALASSHRSVSIKTESVPLTIHPPPQNKMPLLKKVTGSAPPSVPCVATIPPASAAVTPVRQELEMKAIKRQQRMIKNRESACLSRKKKKEYVTALESQIAELQQENVKLKLENRALKERLGHYEESTVWKRPGMLSSNPKKTTAVLAVLFMVTLNIGSFSSLMYRGPEAMGPVPSPLSAQSIANTRHGRSLLWSSPGGGPLPELNVPFGDVAGSIANTSSKHLTCPMSINQTESIRLDSELRRWIGVDFEADDNLTKPTPKMGISSLSKLLLPSPVDKPPIRKSKPKKKPRMKQPSTTSEVEVYGLRTHHYNYAAFFEAIHRRDDTFYVVSFSGDHLLLPALAHNKTLRPKMSLVLPAFPFNESMAAPPNHVTMMQIDCEVTNTQLLHVKEGDIPAHMRHTQRNDSGNISENHFSGSPEKASSKSRSTREFGPEVHSPPMQQSYRPYFMKSNMDVDQVTKHRGFTNESKLDVEFGNNSKLNRFNGSQDAENLKIDSIYTKAAQKYIKRKRNNT